MGNKIRHPTAKSCAAGEDAPAVLGPRTYAAIKERGAMPRRPGRLTVLQGKAVRGVFSA